MYIANFQLINYKSYLETTEIQFRPGFNIVTGKNSAGKTALLEGLALRFDPSPHRSLQTVPYQGASPYGASSARFTLVIDRAEVLRLIGDQQQRYLPRPVQGFSWSSGSYNQSQPESAHAFVHWVFSQPEFRPSIQLAKFVQGGALWTSEGKTLGLYPAEPIQTPNIRYYFPISVDSDGRSAPPGGVGADASQDVSIFLAQHLTQQIYRFTAERFSVGECAFGNNPVLAANAQNLPEVLDVLTANTAKFELFNKLVSEILPQIRNVSVRAHTNGRVQIIIWPHDPKTMRDDLAVPLNECGSGVGQVLAMLYVVLTAVHPQVVIVDEPQNFLHPGAVRKLVEVLKMYPQHQYIFATHSPAVIAAADPQVLIMAQFDDCRTSLSTLNVADSRDLYYSLSDVGASLSDVFGADRILWVEGATEQACFPLIIKQMMGRSLMGTAVIGIRETGDLEGREAERVFQLYNRLSRASVLLPPAVGFVLDSECLPDDKKKDLVKLSRGRLGFISRRMYENYLLNAHAISAVINEIDGFRPSKAVSGAEVQGLIDLKRAKVEFYCWGVKSVPLDWLQSIDGARVLSEIFSELSENRVHFEKTKHCVALTKWLAGNSPADLQEICDLLHGILEGQQNREPVHEAKSAGSQLRN